MNPSYYQNQINKIEKDISDLYKKIADESKKEVNKTVQINNISKSINKSTSISMLQSKQRQIEGYQRELSIYRKKISEYQKKLSDKNIELGKKKIELRKSEDDETKKINKKQLDIQRNLENSINEQRKKLELIIDQSYTSEVLSSNEKIEIKEYDFFISHASEDKDEIVRELADTLKNNGFTVWYDEFELRIGDSLRKKIDQGLVHSKYGIIIISQNFIKKNWTEYELNGMVAREVDGHKVILPIWHKISKNEVIRYSPTLADKFAFNTSIHTIEDIINELKKL